ncbi:MAG TPA: MBL fold metallo-hydrolase [Phycisphaerae bacterium]|nr:MBL fold metallo-hydrolase [Phycisphaerae bacterium]
MIAIALQSGSNGNCIYVQGGGVRLLLDAGISGVQAQRRLARRGVDIRRVDALIISHDHADHVRCAGIYQRKFGIPIYVTPKTLRGAEQWVDLGPLTDVRHFQAGETLDFGGLHVETLPTPHDGADGVAFVAGCGAGRLGVLTDLGHAFEGLRQAIESLDAVFIESNYDPELLRRGPYPEYLKLRIRGPGGHLSNGESAALLAGAGGSRLRWACLSHLSETNNNPELALRTHRETMGERLPLSVAGRYEPTGVLRV